MPTATSQGHADGNRALRDLLVKQARQFYPPRADRPRAVRADPDLRPELEGPPLRDGHAQGGHRPAALRRAATRASLYKKEGFEYFQQMMAGVRDKVTDLIFRARVVGAAQTRSAYRETAAVHEDAGGYGVARKRGRRRRRPAATASRRRGRRGRRRAGEGQDHRPRSRPTSAATTRAPAAAGRSTRSAAARRRRKPPAAKPIPSKPGGRESARFISATPCNVGGYVRSGRGTV